MTIISWKTAFQTIDPKKQYKSAAFINFTKYTLQIAEKLASQRRDAIKTTGEAYNPNIRDSLGFPVGYGSTSSAVLVPAFFAAYTGNSPDKAPFGAFPSLRYLMPNWKISYDGLSNIEFLKKYVRSINLTHAYRSNYSIASFTSNLDYAPDADGLSWNTDLQNNFIPQFELNSVSINEQFAPLIGIDVGFENSLSTRFSINKQRTVALSLANNQVIEMQNNEVVIGAGYRFNQVQIIINAGNGPKQFKSDLNLRADLSIRDSRTVIHKLVEQDDSPSAGQQNVTIKFSADYKLGPSFNLRLFFDRLVNKPFVSTTFPTANTNIGFSVTFQLVQ
jgi:cell surface protein SprA